MESHSQSSHSGIIESFSSDCYERCMSTGIEPFSLLICLGTTEFVLLSVFTLKETICPKICSKSRVQKVYFLLTCVAQKRRCFKVLPKMVAENGIYSAPMKVISNTILFILCAAPSSSRPVEQERVTRTTAWRSYPFSGKGQTFS